MDSDIELLHPEKQVFSDCGQKEHFINEIDVLKLQALLS
jgi:hypothetical protein